MQCVWPFANETASFLETVDAAFCDLYSKSGYFMLTIPLTISSPFLSKACGYQHKVKRYFGFSALINYSLCQQPGDGSGFHVLVS